MLGHALGIGYGCLLIPSFSSQTRYVLPELATNMFFLSAQVVFFMHGILDTSLTWVSNGVTGSQAFAAWDQGVDVWLGNSRSNPPRKARGTMIRIFHYGSRL